MIMVYIWPTVKYDGNRSAAGTMPIVKLLCLSGLIACSQASAQDAVATAPTEASRNEPVQPDFQLSELRVLGNTVLPNLAIAKLLYPYLGPGRTLQDVEAARTALETEYHAQGFGTVFVDIPEQTIGTDGVVRLKVTESRLSRTSFTGTRYFSNRQIRAAIPAATAGTVPNLPQLQAQINAANAVTADRIVIPVLKAGATPGTLELGLKVQDELPLHAAVEVNNQYTADTTKLRSSLVLSYDNAFGRQDSFSLQYQTSPQNTQEVGVFAASYMAHLPDSLNKLVVTYIDSSSQVATVGDINVAGKGKTYSAYLLYPMQTSSEVMSSFTFGLDYKQSAQDVKLSESASLSTPLSYASLQGGYSWLLRSERRIWSWTNTLVLGLPGLGGSRQEFADKCYGCKPSFSIVRTDAGLTQKLPWSFSGVLKVAGQYTVDPVISNEQQLLGGAHSVRGYLEAEELGDVGIRGSIELHANGWLPKKWPVQLDPYLFFDAGRVSFQQPLPGQSRSIGLQSEGLGVDLTAWTAFTGTLVIAEPLVNSSHTQRGDKRFEFMVRGTW
jgi:hemolysin activation/secretion protein